jgi:hypothetical protein
MSGTTITLTMYGREDGGLRVCCKELPGLILSGKDEAQVLDCIGPVIKELLAHDGKWPPALPEEDRVGALVTAAQEVLDALVLDTGGGEEAYPDDPAYNLNDKGKMQLTMGHLHRLFHALDPFKSAAK